MDSTAVLCCPAAVDIDERGKILHRRPVLSNIVSHDPERRFGELIGTNHSCLEVFGLVPLAELRQTSLIGPYVGSDRVLLAELGLRGRFRRLEEPLFLHREHPMRSTRALPCLQDRLAWFDPSRGGRLTFPAWRLLREYVRCVDSSGLPAKSRLRCYRRVLSWVRWNYPSLLGDCLYAVRWGFRRRRAGTPAGQKG
jgi:hypothetical protein